MPAHADFDARLSADREATAWARLGGHLALDFVNTADFRGTPRADDCLGTAQRVLAWSGHAGLLSAADVERQARTLQRQPARARPLLDAALSLREALYDLFAALARGESAAPQAVARLNLELQATAPHHELVADGGTLRWRWNGAGGPRAAVCGPVSVEAAELLTSDDLARLKQCPGCGWLFLDASRNGKRRWCSMEYCGSTAKSRRQYQRRLHGVSAQA